MSDAVLGGQRSLLVYGAGGHGVVVAEAAAAAGWRVVGFIDDDARTHRVLDWPVSAPDSMGGHEAEVEVVIAVGDNPTRHRLGDQLESQGRSLATVVHPTAWVSPSAQLGRGVFIAPQAVVHSRAGVGHGAIVNTGAIVEHDTVIGDYAHVGPNAAVGALAVVGTRTLIGLGASVRSGTTIGDRCTVGVGAAVVSDVADGLTVVGVPARPVGDPSVLPAQ